MFHPTRLGLAATVATGLFATTAAPATPAVPQPAQPATTASTAAAALPDWRTTATVSTDHRAKQPKVVGLRYAEHARFDRVVIDVRGLRPGYTVSYTRRLSYDGSGERVPLKGRKKMFLTLTPAYAHNGAGADVYDGPRLRQLRLPTLRGVAFTGDFEGYVSFGFTTDRRAPYRVFSLTNPSRIVLDWRH